MTPTVKEEYHVENSSEAVYVSIHLMNPVELFAKRVIDIVVASAVMVFFAPFMLILGIIIRLDSRGPMIFSQKRMGKDGREFWMHKLRTMVVNAEDMKSKLVNEVDGPMFKVSADPRVTNVGRFLRRWSIDELPQIYNVFKGEMSLVGPRPLADLEMRKNEHWRAARMSVKPGLTGLWQIKGRGSHRFSDWVKYDTEYVRKFSLWLDIKILFLTIGAVLGRKGAE